MRAPTKRGVPVGWAFVGEPADVDVALSDGEVRRF